MGWSWGGYAMMWLARAHGPLQGHRLDDGRLRPALDVLLDGGALVPRVGPRAARRGRTPRATGSRARRRTSRRSRRRRSSSRARRTSASPTPSRSAFFTDLQKRGVPSRLVVFENSGHWPGWYDMVLYYAAHLDWFHRVSRGRRLRRGTRRRWRRGEGSRAHLDQLCCPTLNSRLFSQAACFGDVPVAPRLRTERPYSWIATSVGANDPRIHISSRWPDECAINARIGDQYPHGAHHRRVRRVLRRAASRIPQWIQLHSVGKAKLQHG